MHALPSLQTQPHLEATPCTLLTGPQPTARHSHPQYIQPWSAVFPIYPFFSAPVSFPLSHSPFLSSPSVFPSPLAPGWCWWNIRANGFQLFSLAQRGCSVRFGPGVHFSASDVRDTERGGNGGKEKGSVCLWGCGRQTDRRMEKERMHSKGLFFLCEGQWMVFERQAFDQAWTSNLGMSVGSS